MKVKIGQFTESEKYKLKLKVKFYLKFLINLADNITTSGEVSLKPFLKIGNVDLSANSSAIFRAFSLSSVLLRKSLNI